MPSCLDPAKETWLCDTSV
ncbi:hypothetical protein F383_34504 [Gossypium arboreum]|uniref:Uncharacterized protein n=1 Tax=Gossypium arboreum TaxID=29729 RepID=A0A0B0N7T1_GOSAR|nr:hypothetical protein F383_34504 [Gossypium arboreum]